MGFLDYYAPQKKEPLPFRLSGGLRADAYTLIRGLCVALLLVCFSGGGFRLVHKTGGVWCAEWTSGSLLLMRLDPPYAQRFETQGLTLANESPPDFVRSIVTSSSSRPLAGFAVGHWPYANWILLPFWIPLALSTLGLILIWRKTRLEPQTSSRPSPPAPPT